MAASLTTEVITLRSFQSSREKKTFQVSRNIFPTILQINEILKLHFQSTVFFKFVGFFEQAKTNAIEGIGYVLFIYHVQV